MTAERAALSRAWPVGPRVCRLTIPMPKPGAVMAACIEWAPDIPVRLSPDELEQYRIGRDRALAELCGELGVRAAVLEV